MSLGTTSGMWARTPKVGRRDHCRERTDSRIKARNLAEAWKHVELGKYYQAGECPPSNVVLKDEEEVCGVTPHSEAAHPRKVPMLGGKPIESSVQRSSATLCPAAVNRVVVLPPVGTAASPELHGFVGVLKQNQKKVGGIVKHNTNAVKNEAATQAFVIPGDNVYKGSSLEPTSRKAKQPVNLAARVPARGRGGVLVGRRAVWVVGQPPGRHGSSHFHHPRAACSLWHDQSW
eukprot:jgi/Tetstr1/422363/TSEL_013203.t1